MYVCAYPGVIRAWFMGRVGRDVGGERGGTGEKEKKIKARLVTAFGMRIARFGTLI
jgi:hypothetical protein